MNAEMIEVTVKIPGAKLGKFYQLLGGLLAEEESPAEAKSHEARQGELPAWTKNDLQLATEHCVQLSEPAQKLYEIFMKSPGQKFSGTELASKLHLEKGAHGIAGLTAWPGRYAYAVGRRLPISWERTQYGVGSYWMTEEVAQLFRNAKEANTKP